ncbi:hypothetical protein ACVME8_009085 [Bradyrhizobium diazoefficiens]
MVATGVADRARERVTQLIYLDAFVPRDGQSLFDLNESGREPMRKAAAAGDGYRIPPNPPPPDTPQADLDWLNARRINMPIKCFETKLKLEGHAAQLHLLHALSAGRRVRAVREAHEERGWLALFRARRESCAERDGAGGVDGGVERDRRLTHSRHSGACAARTRNPSLLRLCRLMDSGLVLRTPRNDGG